MAKNKLSKAFTEHMGKRMHAFKEGEMHSRVKHTGPVVTEKSQAVAIALSEAREKGLKGAPPEKKKKHHSGEGVFGGGKTHGP